jgi:hypothetical protein
MSSQYQIDGTLVKLVECLLLFGSESFFFSMSFNISISVVLYGYETISHTKGRTQIEAFGEQGVEKNIWTQEGGSGGRLDETA